jgi:hypothetical protein
MPAPWMIATFRTFSGITSIRLGVLSITTTGQRLKPSPRQMQRLRDIFGEEAEAMLRPIDSAAIAPPSARPS